MTDKLYLTMEKWTSLEIIDVFNFENNLLGFLKGD